MSRYPAAQQLFCYHNHCTNCHNNILIKSRIVKKEQMHNISGAALPQQCYKSVPQQNARKTKASRIREPKLTNGKALGHGSTSFEQPIRALKTLAPALLPAIFNMDKLQCNTTTVGYSNGWCLGVRLLLFAVLTTSYHGALSCGTQ